MIRVSTGTAYVLGLIEAKQITPPTTAYLMLGEKCINNCAFCAQSKDSKAGGDMLSRVKWPEFPADDVINKLAEKYKNKTIKRVCFQVLNQAENINKLENWIKEIAAVIDIPIAVSINLLNEDKLEQLLNSGVSNISVSLDAANEDLHLKIKAYEQDKTWKVLKNLALKYPSKIRTHLIAGLGETEEEMVEIIQSLTNLNIPVSLFAFTPIKGTKLEKKPPPDLKYYRRIQLAYFLIQRRIKICFSFKDNKIVWPKNLTKILSSMNFSKAFKTTGCTGCNRPYYNEAPGLAFPYNYPRDLTFPEAFNALETALN